MARHTLYAFPDGRIPATTFCELELTLTQLLQTVSWCQSPRVVSNGNGKEKTVGYNLELPDPGMEETDWYRDIESIATLLASLVDKTHLTFVIGIHDSSSNISLAVRQREISVTSIAIQCSIGVFAIALHTANRPLMLMKVALINPAFLALSKFRSPATRRQESEQLDGREGLNLPGMTCVESPIRPRSCLPLLERIL